jgi:hypothetical protein
LVPFQKRPGLKAGAFSRALLVPVAATGINGLYKSGLKAFFSTSVDSDFASNFIGPRHGDGRIAADAISLVPDVGGVGILRWGKLRTSRASS